MSKQLQGLQNLLGASVQPEDCLITRGNPGPSTNPTTPSTSATMSRAPSPVPGLSPVSEEELGRKRSLPHEPLQSASNSESPTSRPPSDKRNNVLRSVVIQELPKVGYRGVPMPQMAMSEVMER